LRLGILGGAFNPPHLGHLILAQEAHSQLGLDTVVFVPYAEPTHRSLEQDPGAEARFTMCEYAVGADSRFGVSRIEIDRGGPSYTVDTLRELRRRAAGADSGPAAGADSGSGSGSDSGAGSDPDELFLVLGGDQAASLPSWRDPEEVLSLAVVAVAERDQWRRDEIAAALSELGSSGDRVRFFNMPRVDISSTDIRARARERRPIRYLVPDKVANYVGAQSLYGASAPRSDSSPAPAPDSTANPASRPASAGTGASR
jgi:nicotinate-nucleotide adenylyltransferase